MFVITVNCSERTTECSKKACLSRSQSDTGNNFIGCSSIAALFGVSEAACRWRPARRAGQLLYSLSLSLAVAPAKGAGRTASCSLDPACHRLGLCLPWPWAMVTLNVVPSMFKLFLCCSNRRSSSNNVPLGVLPIEKWLLMDYSGCHSL